MAAGHDVVATARSAEAVTQALGEADNLLALALDINDLAQSESAADAAVERFGRIDVLVNNAGNFIAGFFEELSPAQVQAQVGTLLFGTMNVTRAVLPTMRSQHAGHVVTISSTAGLVGQTFCSAYAAGKFGVEGFIEALATEVEQYGVTTTLVEPGFFRTELLTPESTSWAELSLGRRRRRRRRGQGPHAAGAGRRAPRALKLPRPRRGVARRTPSTTHRPGRARQWRQNRHRPCRRYAVRPVPRRTP